MQTAGHWVQPYAIFCYLRDLFGTAEHWRWGALAAPTPEVCAAWIMLPQQAALVMRTQQGLHVC